VPGWPAELPLALLADEAGSRLLAEEYRAEGTELAAALLELFANLRSCVSRGLSTRRSLDFRLDVYERCG
jgi:hypothetical protein